MTELGPPGALPLNGNKVRVDSLILGGVPDTGPWFPNYQGKDYGRNFLIMAK